MRFQKYQKGLLLIFLLIPFISNACGEPEWPVHEAKPAQKPDTSKYKNPQLNILPGKPGQKVIFPKLTHLASCNSDSDCGGQFRCLDLFGAGSMCFFKCDPKKGTSGVQNPDCIKPENCIELSNGDGVCVDLPSQLFGAGSYKTIVNLKPGEKCLLRYGGCVHGYICVDTAKNGSIGTCQEECIPAVDPNSKVQPVCKTKGTVCKRLASGYGACLPK